MNWINWMGLVKRPGSEHYYIEIKIWFLISCQILWPILFKFSYLGLLDSTVYDKTDHFPLWSTFSCRFLGDITLSLSFHFTISPSYFYISPLPLFQMLEHPKPRSLTPTLLDDILSDGIKHHWYAINIMFISPAQSEFWPMNSGLIYPFVFEISTRMTNCHSQTCPVKNFWFSSIPSKIWLVSPSVPATPGWLCQKSRGHFSYLSIFISSFNPSARPVTSAYKTYFLSDPFSPSPQLQC